MYVSIKRHMSITWDARPAHPYASAQASNPDARCRCNYHKDRKWNRIIQAIAVRADTRLPGEGRGRAGRGELRCTLFESHHDHVADGRMHSRYSMRYESHFLIENIGLLMV